MQTKFVILASIFGGISALSFSTNQNLLLSLCTALVASALYLSAYLSKDKKDKQIEEIHAMATNKEPTKTGTSQIMPEQLSTVITPPDGKEGEPVIKISDVPVIFKHLRIDGGGAGIESNAKITVTGCMINAKTGINSKAHNSDINVESSVINAKGDGIKVDPQKR